ncbi:alpha/beta fold hydrolase [Rhizobium sp. YTU87027]|uniref:alpha/beta fold hydrolase n=1 Tax=Rhizobium sp. YTU87027 TaxID=3417741 RepID=UPI003D6974A9
MTIEILPPNQDEWAGAKRKIRTRSGIELAYVEWGDVAAPAVILIHGYTDNSRAYSLVAPFLKGRRFVAIELRGHGDSQKVTRDINLLSFAADVSELMDELGIEKADIVGHSMGSMTAAVLAAFYGHKVNKVVLIATAMQLSKATADWLQTTVESQTFPLDVNGAFLNEWTWNPHPIDQNFMKYLKQEATVVPHETWKGCLVALEVTNWSLAATRIKAPVFVMWGDQDQFFNAEDQEAVKSALPDAKYKTYRNYGHSVTWEIPQVAANDIMEFLNDPA